MRWKKTWTNIYATNLVLIFVRCVYAFLVTVRHFKAYNHLSYLILVMAASPITIIIHLIYQDSSEVDLISNYYLMFDYNKACFNVVWDFSICLCIFDATLSVTTRNDINRMLLNLMKSKIERHANSRSGTDNVASRM